MTGPSPRPSRRELLATIGAGSAAGLAGCSASLGFGSEDGGAATWDAGGPPDREDWRVTFADSFDGGALDRDVWSIGSWAESTCAGGSVDVCFVEDHVHVDADREQLRLEASTETPEPPADARPPERDNQHSAGAVTTKDAFAQEFGYFEVEARLPDEPGTLPACWLFCQPADHDWREIDVVEKNGSAPADVVTCSTWFEQDDDDGPDGDAELLDNEDRINVHGTDDEGDATVSPPADEAFHVYAVEWAPEHLVFHIDGDVVGRVDDPGVAEYMPGQELFWILNNSVHEPSEWLGDPADATFPTTMAVDWVRTWQHEDWGEES